MSHKLSAERTRGDRPVLLVVPPFQGLKVPSLGTSLLKANLVAHGIPAEILYLNLRFADRIDLKLHEWLGSTGPSLLGEFLFSRVAHQAKDGDVERYVDEILRPAGLEWFGGHDPVGFLRHLMREAKDFVENEAMEAILARDPWLVGCSSTFQSNCCSLALIQELKRRRPDIFTLMGGANCEVEQGVELMANYPALDFVGRGECDNTFVEFARNLRNGGSGRGMPGFVARGDETPQPPSAPLHRAELDANPYPDFDDYFAQIRGVSFRDEIYSGLSMETSRGCWWGQKSHCTFCAFNRDGMIFRSKTPQRALDELHAQVGKYGISRVEFTDNILDMGYFKTFVPALAREPVADSFWETKSNLTRDQVRLMAQAKMRWIQPGIESLSDQTLKLMRKGSTGLQNVQLLKWCAESGIRVTWNWLFGFPGEDEGEVPGYGRLAAAIHHLEPPSSSEVLYLERSSPYFNNPEEWNLQPIRPAAAYHHVYPWPTESLHRMAFFFEAEHFDAKEAGTAHRELKRFVQRWNVVHRRSHLVGIPRTGSLILLDTRPVAKRFWRRLQGLERRVYEFCWKIRGKRDIVRTFEGEAPAEAIEAILQSFVDDALVLQVEDRFLNLATDPRLDYKSFIEEFPGGGFTSGTTFVDARQKSLRLVDVLTLRAKPRELVRAMRRRAGVARAALINLSVAALIKLLAQRQPRLAPPDEALEPEAAPAECASSASMTGS